MTDTNRHDSPADRRTAGRRRNRLLHAQTQKVRDGQGSLMLFSQFPEPDEKAYPPGDPLSWPRLKPNQRGSHFPRPTS